MNRSLVIKSAKPSPHGYFAIMAEDSTGGISHFTLEQKYGTPKVGDNVTLHYNGNGGKFIGVSLNGTRLY